MQILGQIASLASLICWIIVLISMFKADKILPAILGIICPLWAFIWGWMNRNSIPQKNIMLYWTVAIIIGAIGGGIAANSVISQ